jgi:hypothetical protein
MRQRNGSGQSAKPITAIVVQRTVRGIRRRAKQAAAFEGFVGKVSQDSHGYRRHATARGSCADLPPRAIAHAVEDVHEAHGFFSKFEGALNRTVHSAKEPSHRERDPDSGVGLVLDDLPRRRLERTRRFTGSIGRGARDVGGLAFASLTARSKPCSCCLLFMTTL